MRAAAKAVRTALFVAAFTSLARPLRAQAGSELTLKRAWVTKYAERTSIAITMDVRHSHTRPNRIKSGGDDGDMHFSGVSTGVGLPFVAEIVNAGLEAQQPAVQDIIAASKDSTSVAVTGAWRLWFEHPAQSQTQGGDNAFYPDHTNPNHSFEIHPISREDDHSLVQSFIPIRGYAAYPAEKAFPYFDSCVVTIKASRSGISLRSKKLKYNYVRFHIQLAEDPMPVSDGFIVPAEVLNETGEDDVVSGARRMIIVGGTPAASVIGQAKAGDRFEVLGIPRISLYGVLELVRRNGTAQFNAALPYEMIVVGVYD